VPPPGLWVWLYYVAVL